MLRRCEGLVPFPGDASLKAELAFRQRRGDSPATGSPSRESLADEQYLVAPAVFLAREITDKSVVFENPEHDFPQRVGYRRADGGGLAAWIEGTTNGKSRHIDFLYSRAACAGN